MAKIHPLAAVDTKAKIAENVDIAPFAVIEAGAEIGEGCWIGAHAYITKWARLGKNVQIGNGAVIATNPQDLKFGGEESYLEIGDNSIIREFATLNRGTSASGKTVIGKECLIMAYCHVAHDCRIHDHVIMTNNAALAGHVELEEWARLGAFVPVHQFVRIGKHAFIGAFYRVPLDVPPFIIAAGEPMTYRGVNSIGLARRGFHEKQIRALKNTYRILYRSSLNISQALEKIEAEIEKTPEVEEVIRFIQSRDKRGIMK